MISFMFGVLFTDIFWAFYFIAGFVVGTILIRKYAPNTYYYFKSGDGVFPSEYWVTALLNYLFWLPILIWILIYTLIRFILVTIFKPMFIKMFFFVDDNIPEISMNVKNKNNNKNPEDIWK